MNIARQEKERKQKYSQRGEIYSKKLKRKKRQPNQKYSPILQKSLGTTKSTANLVSTPAKSIPSATVCISDLGKQEQAPIMYIDVMLTPNDPCDRIPIY